jgi:hypothetical protein
LVCNYIRYQGLSVYEGSIFEGYHLIIKYKPKVLFITNSTGASINQDVTRFAKKKGIKIVTSISEGNLKENILEEMVWGHNNEQISYEDKYLVWSNRSQSMALEKYPELSNIIKTAGSAGHDRYIINNGIKRKNNKTVTVGVGCWGFDYFIDNENSEKCTLVVRDFFLNQRDRFNQLLSELIIKNQDIQFILKEHPGNMFGYEGSAIESCVSFPNVKVYKDNKKSIMDCILDSDLWITYDSSTALEAWLLKKQTCILNPAKSVWPCPRDQMHTGQPIYGSVEELQAALDAIKVNKCISGFDELKEKRKEIIKDVIEWDDGLNHVRIGNEIIGLIENNVIPLPLDTRLKLPSRREIIKQRIKWFVIKYIPLVLKIRKTFDPRIIWNNNEIKKYITNKMLHQIQFYKDLGLDKRDLRRIRAI